MNKQESKKRKMTGTMKKKLAGLFVLILLAFVFLIIGITIINAKSGDKYTKQVLAQSQQQYDSTTIPYKRGDILDRSGNILATSIKVYNVILDCQVVNSRESFKEPTKQALSEYLGIDEDTVEELLTSEETKDSPYQILKKQISMDEKKNFEKMTEIPADKEEAKALSEEETVRRNNTQGVWFEEDYERTYPLNELACDVVGFTYSGNTADWGLEGYYNSTLNGTDGRKIGYFNDDASLDQNIIDPVNGNSLVTTLDVNIQSVVDKYIEAFMENLKDGPNTDYRGARNIGVIVANPKNGEILAMGSNDPYDLNNPRDLTAQYSDSEIKAMNDDQTKEALYKMWRNYCITDAYEPGSVVKPITVASALESGSITEEDTFVCDGGEQVADRYINCAVYPDSHGTETVGEAIQNSCNDALMAIGRKMGKETLLSYQDKFNFGTRTGIDLPGEGTGILFSLDNMFDTELATTTFGQGFTCTMIQEIAAISACINGGTYYQPHLVKEIRDQDNNTIKSISGNVLKEVISQEVSADIRKYMGMSVEHGTSQTAKIPGYSMGGKTGTAEKVPRGNHKYLVSFVGFAPLDDPEVVIYVVVDEPNVEEQASSTYAQY
ncbi:MAG: peptidoglycan D,D-transpeptidase FtsI family protein, partial [Blautia coccoides]